MEQEPNYSEEKQWKVLSINTHVTGKCNSNCRHCFDRCLRSMQYMRPDEWRPYLEWAKSHGIEKVNIAGGEPFLYPYLEELCQLIKSYGFKVSIVSNGSLITDGWIAKLKGVVDWIGLSVDSPDNDDEIIIGRCCKDFDHIANIKAVAKKLKTNGIRVKLNITVVRESCKKDFRPLIEEISADRVKVFRVLTLKGANDDVPDTWSITDEEWEEFQKSHKDCRNIVFENNDDMVCTYMMFSPDGRWMIDKDSVKQFLPFETLVRDGMESVLDAKKYCDRNAVYDW